MKINKEMNVEVRQINDNWYELYIDGQYIESFEMEGDGGTII